MKVLHIDIETYSRVDLTKCGVYAYSESDDFEILLFAYAVGEEEVRVIDLKNGECIPSHIEDMIFDEKILKSAFNANFERVCLERYYNRKIPLKSISCTQVKALSLGLPISLDSVSKVMKLKNEKMSEGKALIKLFSTPNKRDTDGENKDKWELFKNYCKRDVEVERDIDTRLCEFEFLEIEKKLWCLDQEINDRGIEIDEKLVSNAIDCHENYIKDLKDKAFEISGIKNLNSRIEVKNWLLSYNIDMDKLDKENIAKLLENIEKSLNIEENIKESLDIKNIPEKPIDLENISKKPIDIKNISEKPIYLENICKKDLIKIREVLIIKQETSKTSIKKYQAMKRALGWDLRIRGLFQFYGASKTGRWASRLVQVQNLPATNLKDLDKARNIIKSGDYEKINHTFESTSKVLSQLIRTAFVPRKNHKFIIADFSAIEARIIAYLAQEMWRMEVFNSHGRIYEASAARMFKVEEDSVTKGSNLRSKGKIAELALGYQGSKGALIAMGGLKMGLSEDELMDLVKFFRKSNPNIVKFWYEVEEAAVVAVREKRDVKLRCGVKFIYDRGTLFVELLSGRKLAYMRVKLEREKDFSREIITYEAVDQTTKRWTRIKTYGGKLTENIVQAIARDVLGVAMIRLKENSYNIVMHVHDEVVLEVDEKFQNIEKVNEIMSREISWAKNLPLKVEAFESRYYRK